MKRTFAARLRTARQAADLTQEQLARAARVSLRTVARLEADAARPRYETQRKLEKVLPGLEP